MCHIPRTHPGTFICPGVFIQKLIFQATCWRHQPTASGILPCVNAHSEGAVCSDVTQGDEMIFFLLSSEEDRAQN